VTAAVQLVVDAVTAEIVGAFGARGISSLVLKGPAVNHWLYEAVDSRAYVDMDVLVPPADLARARDVLAGLGFVMELGDDDVPDRGALHGHAWRRQRDSAVVDLHNTFYGVGVSSAEFWKALEDHREALSIGGVDAAIPDRAATALIAALHAAWHGPFGAKALLDLARAAEHFDLETWKDAAKLAMRLRATEAFAAGLRLAPAGVVVSAELALPDDLPLHIVLSASSERRGTLALYRLLTARSWRERALFARRKLVPSPALMRHMYPLARSRYGLVALYVARPFVLGWRLGFALRELVSARAETRWRSGSGGRQAGAGQDVLAANPQAQGHTTEAP
jgi:Uncharacterised nucleotidyltransferase